MSKALKKVCVCGHFGNGENLLNGQTVKTKIVTAEIERVLGANEINRIDTHGGIKKLLWLPFVLCKALKSSSNVVILPAQNGLRVIAPILVAENFLFRRKLHYAVIGGWLPDFLQKRKFLAGTLKKFNRIYVETNTMKTALEDMGFKNVSVMPNCKELKILDKSDLAYSFSKPYKLCTFSRVMLEKGIEDAVNAVKSVNNKYGKAVFSLDIYGQIDSEQTLWFENLQKTFPEYIKYRGLVPFDKSTEILKDYYALLFPTFYSGEGFAGTLIDAMAAGVPVVASSWKYNSEIVRHGKNGYIFPTKDTEALSGILERISLEPDKWNSMRACCIEEAQKYLPCNVMTVLLKEL